MLRIVGEQFVDVVFFLRQLVELAAQFHLLKPAQAAQPRIENVIGLNVGEIERRFEEILRLFLFADDADHFIEIEEDDAHAGENFEPMRDFGEPEARTPLQHGAAVIEPLPQRLFQRDHAGDHAVHKHVHVHREAAFKLCRLEKLFHHQRRIDGAGARLDDDAHILGRFVADVGDERQFLVAEKLGDLLDQPRLLHHVGDFGDDDIVSAARPFLALPFRAHAERAAPGTIGLGDLLRRIDNDAAGRKVRSRHEFQQIFVGRVFMRDEMHAGVAKLGNIMRRNGGRHADGNALRAIGEKIGESCGQDDRLGLIARIILAEIDCILVDAFEQQTGNFRHPRFGVAIGRGAVAVDIAEIALPVDERIA